MSNTATQTDNTKQPRLNLMGSGEIVDRTKLASYPTPIGTRSWNPIGHIDLLRMTEDAVQRQGMDIVEQQFLIDKDGERFFGMLSVRSNLTGMYNVVGVRNTHDKAFAAQLVAGSNVMICSNLCIAGQIGMKRKHTSNIMRDLPGRVLAAVGEIKKSFITQEQQMTSYQQTALSEHNAKAALVDLLKAGAISGQQLPKVLAEYENPTHDEQSQLNVDRLFQATTQVYKAMSADRLVQRAPKLHMVCDKLVAANTAA